jgi:hypothetical protein
VRLLTEYEISRILTKAEEDYIKKVKGLRGSGRRFNMNAVYTLREIRKKVNNYLDKKYENQ